jgi:acyl-CoA hydrolase
VPPTSRTVADSEVVMTEIVLPEDSNPRGTIFGGRVLALLDKCAAVAAIRHARSEAVTVSLDSVTFVNTVRVGDVLSLHGRLNAAFGSSMEVEVNVHSEDPLTGERRLTTTAFVTMVALDENGRPRAVPALAATTDDEKKRRAAARDRRATRLAQRRDDTR